MELAALEVVLDRLPNVVFVGEVVAVGVRPTRNLAEQRSAVGTDQSGALCVPGQKARRIVGAGVLEQPFGEVPAARNDVRHVCRDGVVLRVGAQCDDVGHGRPASQQRSLDVHGKSAGLTGHDSTGHELRADTTAAPPRAGSFWRPFPIFTGGS